MRYRLLALLLFLFGLHTPFKEPTTNIIMWTVPYFFVSDRIAEQTVSIVWSTTGSVDRSDNFSLSHGNSLTAQQIDDVLKNFQSPAMGAGKDFVAAGEEYTIDNAYLLYIFIHESTAGTNRAWVGWKTDTETTHNIGNIICTEAWALKNRCYKRFRDYDTWRDGIFDAAQLLAYYRDEMSIKTIDDAIRTWAPPHENDTEAYVNALKRTVTLWRSQPARNNRVGIVTDNETITAGFYTANCAFWSFQAGCQHFGTDFAANQDAPVYAPVDCSYITTGFYPDNTPQQGYYFMCGFEQNGDTYELYMGHLNKVRSFAPGQLVRSGTIIAQIWKDHTHVQLKKNGELIDFLSIRNE